MPEKHSGRIIVVDDNRMLLKQASRVIKDSGLEVESLFTSGKAFLSYIKKGNRADLVLLDVVMPEMDGFETLKALRQVEAKQGYPETPVVFLTAEAGSDTEIEGLTIGASDYIRKPFEPSVFIQRIRNVLTESEKVGKLSKEATNDGLTGLLNKTSIQNKLGSVCTENAGALVVFDLDNFKLINDMYGHDKGDLVLSVFAKLLNKNLRAADNVGRIGGDEFVAFLDGVWDEKMLNGIVERLNKQLLSKIEDIIGKDNPVSIGVSAGAAITEVGDEYEKLFKKADGALLEIKQNGKHACKVWKEENGRITSKLNFKKLDMLLEERNVGRQALMLEQKTFVDIYRYMLRFIKRYDERVCKVLITITPNSGSKLNPEISRQYGSVLQNSLRNSDLILKCSTEQYFVVMPSASLKNADGVMKRIEDNWKTTKNADKITIKYITELVK